jgi:hypothetical protein
MKGFQMVLKRMKIGIFLLLIFVSSCFLDRGMTQYIAIRHEGKLKPIAKIVYKVSVERQEVIYWIEATDDTRSDLTKLKNCIVADVNNWEGDAIGFPNTRIKVVDGNFEQPDGNFKNVSWWVWHFKTEPKPSNLALLVGCGIAILFTLGIIASILDGIKKRREKKKILTQN